MTWNDHKIRKANDKRKKIENDLFRRKVKLGYNVLGYERILSYNERNGRIRADCYSRV